MDPVGIEAFTDPAEFLPNLKIIQANAADNKVLVPLIKQAFYILWNGILFEQNAGPVLVSLETYSRYSTIIMTNVELNEPRADSKVQFKIFGPESIMTDWDKKGKDPWKIYVALPRKLDDDDIPLLPIILKGWRRFCGVEARREPLTQANILTGCGDCSQFKYIWKKYFKSYIVTPDELLKKRSKREREPRTNQTLLINTKRPPKPKTLYETRNLLKQ